MALFTKISEYSGKQNSMEIPISHAEYVDYLHDRNAKIQNTFPQLTDDQREFLMTGITPDEWNEIFKDHDE